MITKRLKRARACDRVSFDDAGVTHVRPDGREERIRWEQLCEVGILTTDGGPWADDVIFLLLDSRGKPACAIPQSRTEPDPRTGRHYCCCACGESTAASGVFANCCGSFVLKAKEYNFMDFQAQDGKRGTERVQTFLGIYVSMVGPEGFEPPTKRL